MQKKVMALCLRVEFFWPTLYIYIAYALKIHACVVHEIKLFGKN